MLPADPLHIFMGLKMMFIGHRTVKLAADVVALYNAILLAASISAPTRASVV